MVSAGESSVVPGHVGSTASEMPKALADGVYCVRCGYHLRGVVGDRCPECGYDLAGLRSTQSGIPWSHRRETGRLRAFWATVWAVTFRTRKFCEEHAREVSYRDARLFQWVTILHVFPSVMLLLVALVLYDHCFFNERLMWRIGAVLGTGRVFPMQASREFWWWCVLAMCLLVYLLAITGVPSYFFHPRARAVSQQNAGVAMSYYACAPLAIFPVVGALGALGICFPDFLGDDPAATWKLLSKLSMITVSLVAISWWYNLQRLARTMMPTLQSTRLCTAVLVPILWLLLGLVLLLVFPILAFGGAAFFDSFR